MSFPQAYPATVPATTRRPRPDRAPAPDCHHSLARQYSWYAADGTLCIGCCDCGTILAGAADEPGPVNPTRRDFTAILSAPVAPRVTTQLHAGGGFGISIVGRTPEAIRDALAAELLANRDLYRAALDAAADEHAAWYVADTAAREVARV